MNAAERRLSLIRLVLVDIVAQWGRNLFMHKAFPTRLVMHGGPREETILQEHNVAPLRPLIFFDQPPSLRSAMYCRALRMRKCYKQDDMEWRGWRRSKEEHVLDRAHLW